MYNAAQMQLYDITGNVSGTTLWRIYGCITNLSIAIRNELQESDVGEFVVNLLQLVNDEVSTVWTQRLVVDSDEDGHGKTLPHVTALLFHLEK